MSEAKKLPIGELFELEKGMLQSLKNSPGEFDFITAADEWKTHSEFSHDMEALIFAAAASGSLGRTHYVNGKFITSDLCYILTPKNPDKYPIDLKFYHFVFNSLKEEIVKETKSGTSKESINQKSFKAYELPYFDIEKQNLWIQKLVNTKQHQQELLSELSIQKELVSKLRQSILQEAIEGRLTAQWRRENPDVEPASKLLEKIREEKERLIKEKKIKKEKDLPSINEDAIPFKLPDNWKWCRFQEITTVITCGIASTPQYLKSGRIFLSAKNVKPYKFLPDKHKYINEETYQKIIANAKPEQNDILLTRVGAGIGEAAIIDQALDFAYYVSLTLIKPMHNFIDSKFLLHFLNSKEGIKNAISYTTGEGSSQGNLNVNEVRKFLIPIPPLDEQFIISQKVDIFLEMSNQLELQINESKINVGILMQAVLKEAFEEEPKIAITEPHAPKTFQRSVLAAYLIDNSQDDPFFGHVKLQKMLFMCEAVNNLDFDTDYKRHAMGPYDPKLIRSVDSQLKKAKWFEVKKLEGEISRYVYHPLEKVEEYKKYVGRYWDHKKIEHIFQLMKPMRTLQAEIVATLFSANADLKKTNISITDAILINEARNNWHDNKKNIAVETWEKAIEWMKSKNLL